MKNMTFLLFGLPFIGFTSTRAPKEFPALHAEPPGIQKTAEVKQPHIQVVFVLDATGSMSGLISAAKQKIWSVAGSLSQTQPAPKIEMGMVFYRDIGDAFVTKKTDLSTDLDAMYTRLMSISAGGGGDGPESVNQALAEAVNDFQWSDDSSTYRTIFLVGDFPPHMDYPNDIKYFESCRKAVKKDIIINTVLMGTNTETERIWKELARCSGGSFTQVGMDANNFEISTPYDIQISTIQYRIDIQRIYYGSEDIRLKNEEKLKNSDMIYRSSAPEANARRSDYNNSIAGRDAYYGGNELLNDLNTGKVQLAAIPDKELPVNMQAMNQKEREIYVRKQAAERDSLEKELASLSLKRQEYISTELKKKGEAEVSGSFNSKVYESIQQQTKRKNIQMTGKAKF